MRGTITIDFLSDTCFSMPANLDVSVDSEVALDPLGLPMTPGKTLHGLLRDTWLSVKSLLDPNELGYALLGRPRSMKEEGILRIGDAHIEETIQKQVAAALKREHSALTRAKLRTAFLTTRTLTAQDRERGAPQTETLRMIRVVPAGTTLIAPVQAFRHLTDDEQELLDTLLQLTRHVGLHRNRGLGHVALSFHPDTATETAKPSIGNMTAQAAETFLHYRLTLTAPCLVGGKEIDPNSRKTRDYIPGSAIRGAVAAALVREKASDLETIITSGKVRFLNAYPEVNERRSLPRPITWQRDKDPALEDYNDIPSDKNAHPQDAALELLTLTVSKHAVQREPVRGEFWAFTDNGYEAVKPDKRYSTHQTRNRETGATQKKNGAAQTSGDTTVFVYEAVEAGQSFRGCLALAPGETALAQRLTTLLEKSPLWLGRSIRSSYGGAPNIVVLQAHPHETDADFLPSAIVAGSTFSVRLTSPAVLRDPNTGQFDPWRLHEELTARFDGLATVEAVFLQADTAQGFHRLWRTELSEVPCAAAGSTALLKATIPLSQAKLLELQANPLGERATEGYGCFLIAEAKANIILKESKKPEADMETTATSSQGAIQAQQRCYQARLRQLIGIKAKEDAGSIETRKLPSPSLLQRLRTPLRSDNWRTVYGEWFSTASGNEERKLRDTALRPLKEICLHGTLLNEFLRRATEDQWTISFADVNKENDEREQHRFVSEEEAQTLWGATKQELRLYYLDVLLGAMAKRAKRNSQEATE